MEHDKRFLKGFFCGLGVTVVCGLFAYFISGEIIRYNLLENISNSKTEANGQTETNKEELSQTLKIDHTALLTKMEEIEERINKDYLNTIDSEKVEAQIYKGLVKGLEDPYAAYYTKEELETIKESTSGSYKGIGARMVQDKETGVISIVNCFEGTPAEKAGLLPGDMLYKVDEEEVTGVDLSLVVSEIKSKEKIHLTIAREGEADYIEIDVTAEEINIPTVYSEMLENNIGYLQVTEFDTVTKTQFTDAMSELKSQGMTKLVIDLRDNPGGVLQVVCNMLEQILPKGLIVYTEDKYGNRQEYTSEGEGDFNMPLVLLVNENSASASEIFAGAVKDYGIGTIVGTTTYGKGIVQRIENLSDGTALKLTVENYYTPKGNNIHGIGIEPDVTVELDKTAKSKGVVTREKDNQLQKAMEILVEK